MNFQIDKTADINGSGLLQALSGAPCPAITSNITKLFGKVRGANAKYSDILAVRHIPTGELYTVYTCYGAWRVGGFWRLPMTALGELLELLAPAQFAGATGKEAEQLIDLRPMVPAPAPAADDEDIPY